MRPDWAYAELARQRKLRLEALTPGRPRLLAGGDSLVIRRGVIGTVREGSFTAWPVGRDIVIGGVLYMPPAGSPYRGVAGVLGRYRLNLGGAIGLHGTLDSTSIGRAVTHGCLRLGADDLAWLYLNAPVGTPVFIY
jgi:lipoprotein-anchoring transpeptidase ErfK/SrfK